jgi:hypothetical protein
MDLVPSLTTRTLNVIPKNYDLTTHVVLFTAQVVDASNQEPSYQLDQNCQGVCYPCQRPQALKFFNSTLNSFVGLCMFYSRDWHTSLAAQLYLITLHGMRHFQLVVAQTAV